MDACLSKDTRNYGSVVNQEAKRRKYGRYACTNVESGESGQLDRRGDLYVPRLNSQ